MSQQLLIKASFEISPRHMATRTATMAWLGITLINGTHTHWRVTFHTKKIQHRKPENIIVFKNQLSNLLLKAPAQLTLEKNRMLELPNKPINKNAHIVPRIKFLILTSSLSGLSPKALPSMTANRNHLDIVETSHPRTPITALPPDHAPLVALLPP